MVRNPGHLPLATRGKRVRVELANGMILTAPADGPGGVKWGSTDKRTRVVRWEVA